MELIFVVLSILLLSITLSIDALFAGFSYGLSKTRIPLGSKLVICAFSVIYSALAIFIGGACSNVLTPLAGKIVGAVILALLGISMIIKSLRTKKKQEKAKSTENDEAQKTILKVFIKSLGITIEILKNNVNEADVDHSGIIDKKEALLLGFALSVDSLGAGIGFALSGVFSFYIPFVIGIFQLVFLSSGLSFGFYCSKKKRKCGKLSEKIINILPGVLLIALSVIRLI